MKDFVSFEEFEDGQLVERINNYNCKKKCEKLSNENRKIKC